MELVVVIRRAVAAMRAAMLLAFGRVMVMPVRLSVLNRFHGLRDIKRREIVSQHQCDRCCEHREDDRQNGCLAGGMP